MTTLYYNQYPYYGTSLSMALYWALGESPTAGPGFADGLHGDKINSNPGQWASVTPLVWESDESYMVRKSSLFDRNHIPSQRFFKSLIIYRNLNLKKQSVSGLSKNKRAWSKWWCEPGAQRREVLCNRSYNPAVRSHYFFINLREEVQLEIHYQQVWYLSPGPLPKPE